MKLTDQEKRERRAAYRVANKEKIMAYRAATKEKRRAYNRAWRAANPRLKSAETKRWRLKNPARVRANKAQRRAAQLQRTVSWSNKKLIEQVYKQARALTVETGELYHVDHIIPLKGKLVSGLHVETNLQAIPAKDNLSKSNKFQPLTETEYETN